MSSGRRRGRRGQEPPRVISALNGLEVGSSLQLPPRSAGGARDHRGGPAPPPGSWHCPHPRRGCRLQGQGAGEELSLPCAGTKAASGPGTQLGSSCKGLASGGLRAEAKTLLLEAKGPEDVTAASHGPSGAPATGWLGAGGRRCVHLIVVLGERCRKLSLASSFCSGCSSSPARGPGRRQRRARARGPRRAAGRT